MNENGTVAAIDPFSGTTAEVLHWSRGKTTPDHLAWNENILTEPHAAQIYGLTDQDTLALRSEAMDNPFLLPPATLQIETNLVELSGTGWHELSAYSYFNDIDLTLTQGGRLYAIAAINNYRDTIGLVYEDEAHSTAFEPEPVYSYQNQYFAFNGDTALDFEPLLLNDSGTITGRTPGPLHTMVILDRFGQRYLAAALDEEGAGKIRMSNPRNGLEELILGPHYWRRMQERDTLGYPTDVPAPDFWQGTLGDVIRDTTQWVDPQASCISANGRIAGTGWVYNQQAGGYEEHGFLLVPPVLLPDWDRNGSIDERDRAFSAQGQPLYFWINDDDDTGDQYRSTADDRPASPSPDWANPGVDGLRDVVDFFAVHIDLQEILQVLGSIEPVGIVLKQADEALNFVYTSLSPTDVGDIHRKKLTAGFGVSLTEDLASAQTLPVSAGGTALSQAFLDNLRSANRGVLLFEALRESRKPLIVELHRAGQVVLTTSLPLSIGPVRDMFRIINLRNADPKFAGADPGP